MDSSLLPLLPYIIPSVVTIILTTGIVFYAQRYYNSPMARGVSYMCVAAGVWSFARLCGLLSIDPATNLWWGRFEYFGIVSVPVAWLYFALHYTGNSELITRKRLLLGWIIPCITLVLIWTNDQHGLVWKDIYLEKTGAISFPATVAGPWFWVHTAYSYALILTGVALVIFHLQRAPGLFRAQSILPALALLTPLSVNVVTLAGLLPKSLDLTSSAFGISALFLIWDISRYRLLSLAPIARRVVFDSILDCVIVLDWQNRLVDVNPAAAQLFAIETSEAIGDPLSAWLGQWGALLDFCLADTFGELEVNLAIEEGAEEWYNVQTTPIYGREPTPNGRLIVLHDVTERKLNEQAMITARDEALKADQFKTQLLAKVSHELRTPLSVIHSYVELLQMPTYRDQPERQVVALNTIQENTRQLTKLVNDLLDSAQLDNGNLQLESAPFSPLELVKTVYNQFVIRAESKELLLDYEIDPALPMQISGDFHRLRQVVANLVDNAIKYSETGQIDIRLSLVEAKQWMICVSDQGAGIPAESHEMIFEPFQVLQGARNGKSISYGLGLAIVRQLVSIMQGRVSVQSDTGKGSAFIVLLPLNVPDANN